MLGAWITDGATRPAPLACHGYSARNVSLGDHPHRINISTASTYPKVGSQLSNRYTEISCRLGTIIGQNIVMNWCLSVS